MRPRGGPFIPVGEILLRASRSSGPGGQHANVTASRIEAVFDVTASLVLSPGQKARIERKIGSPVTAIAQDARSQARNRDLALERLEEKLGAALQVPKARRPTRPSRSARQKRLTGKKIRSETKRNRRPPSHDD
ncbi:MAG: aminoacyl-tRNA hydrolase [Solirubrobacterales bacterium]|nr:aminoacyl-tRNA hydrolase [Solirubrobacterales bacterium]